MPAGQRAGYDTATLRPAYEDYRQIANGSAALKKQYAMQRGELREE